MNKSLVIGIFFGSVVVCAGGAFAGYRIMQGPTAEVISSKAVVKTVRSPRQECHDEQVTRTRPPGDTHQLAGTAMGAVVGGLLGHEVGGGSGQVLATVAGAAAGGFAGNRIEHKVQQGNTYTAHEQRCMTAYDTSALPNGYEVTYLLNGQRHHVHLKHDPGKRIALKDGEIVSESE